VQRKDRGIGLRHNIELFHDWLLFRGREPKSAANGREPTLSRRSPFEGNALLNFVNGMLHTLGSVPMLQMSIDRYYRGDA